MHQIISDSPFLGDTTANQALLFSSPYLPFDIPAPTYPNYTLPPANMSQPDQPTSSPNFTLKIFSTSDGLANKPHTACFLQSQVSEGSIANETQWARDNQGWRTQWLLGGLTPSTNYTAFLLESTNVSGPIFFATKSGAFVSSIFSLDLSSRRISVFICLVPRRGPCLLEKRRIYNGLSRVNMVPCGHYWDKLRSTVPLQLILDHNTRVKQWVPHVLAFLSSLVLLPVFAFKFLLTP